jgi:hypothetical protein
VSYKTVNWPDKSEGGEGGRSERAWPTPATSQSGGVSMKERLYMLRVWQDEETKEWHASLKNLETKEVQYFERLESFSQHLTTTIKSDQKAEKKSN